MEMPLAPLPEQRRIVAKLEELFSKLDAGVATVRRTQALLKRYRQSVLHAAVTGELTRAWREAHPAPTETGAALLARIRAERRAQWEAAQVAKRGGQLPLGEGWKSKYVEPEAVDASELPELPSGWAWTTVEQLGVIGEQTVMTGPFGTSLGTSDFVTSGVPVLTIGCLTEGGIKLNKAVHITEEKAAGLERYRLKKGDLLFSRMASVGRAGFVTSELDGILFNYHIMRLRLDAETITPFFFLYYVRGAREVVSYLLRVNHGATRDGINTEQLLNLPVCLPPIAEQIEIIAEVERRLTVLDALSKTLTDELKRAERLRQSILHRAFTGRLVPQDATDEPATVLLARLRNESTAPPKARKAREPKASPASKQLPMPL
ncbi:hypothetical protein AUC43_02395 [Hymenobacter sedentarius]|uniref:Type I restriction modification DNA specificity domain-containing protein n=2 Tax=Hymenobacter sedentarius TaxID=1411621 RepID=A0A0U4BZB3_9BACT|nr:hypothetical protein AUC43_02395 [Hymenobacter sedentarius]